MAAAVTSRLAIAGLLAVLAAGLLWSLVGLPSGPGLAPLVAARLAESGVDSAVTAVLLNFRAHDTLLEVMVLLLSAVAVFTLPPVGHTSPTATEAIGQGPAQTDLLRWYVPRLAVVAALAGGYLWWAGSARPGGAFPGGAVLGGLIALLLLSGRPRPPAWSPWVRLLLAAGPVVFLAIAAFPLTGEGSFFQYPAGTADLLIPTIEVALMLSIAAALGEVVAGVPRRLTPPGSRR